MKSTTVSRLSFEEYLLYADGTDNRYELVNGELILVNPPTGRHALIIKFVERQFDAEIERLGLRWIAMRDTGVRTGVSSNPGETCFQVRLPVQPPE